MIGMGPTFTGSKDIHFGIRLPCPGAQTLKNLPAMRESWVQSLGQEDPLEKGTATCSSIPAWKIYGQRNLVG